MILCKEEGGGESGFMKLRGGKGVIGENRFMGERMSSDVMDDARIINACVKFTVLAHLILWPGIGI